MNKAIEWINDYAYLFQKGAFMYFRHTPPKHYLGHVVEGKVPVIILPGIFSRWALLKPLADHISLLGHPVYIVPKLGNNTGDIPSSSKKVLEVIEENNLKNVIIVAHSKGGLITKYLLTHDNTNHAVKGLIAVATPFHGSSMGSFIPHHSTKELGADSGIIRYLESHNESNNKIVSIIPEYDNHVWNEKGSYLEGALQNVSVKVMGHHRVLGSKEVQNVVMDWIEKITKM